MIGKGCASIILALGIIVILFFGGCTSIMRSFADWRMSANGATVAIQQTEQVRLQEDGATERTKAEWDARVEMTKINADASVEMTEINADTTKKTSGVFIMFYLVRGLMWGAGILLTVGLVGLGAAIWRGVKYEAK